MVCWAGQAVSHEGECGNMIQWPEKRGAGLLRKDSISYIQIGQQLRVAVRAQFNMHKKCDKITRVHLFFPSSTLFTLQVTGVSENEPIRTAQQLQLVSRSSFRSCDTRHHGASTMEQL
jgi:hypothetical protein